MSQYYGDKTRWFIGKVVGINDPLELGRVRVRIFGVHSDSTEDIPEHDLPWAQIVVPTTEGSSSGLGANTGIKDQALVFGIFLDGPDSQIPLVIGSISKFESTNVDKVVTQPEASVTEKADGRPVERAVVRDIPGVKNAEKAYNWFISKEGGDFTPEQAAGIIGNLMIESNSPPGFGDINPIARNKSEGSFGIAQWNPAEAAGNRYGDLLAFCEERGYNYEELEPQLDFITYELFTSEKTALAKVRAAKTVEEATLAFEWFERPQGWSRNGTPSKSHKSRIRQAEIIYDQMESA